MSTPEEMWKPLDYMLPWSGDSKKFRRRRRLFDKSSPPASAEADSFSHSPDSARLADMVKQLKQPSASESQETYKLLESLFSEYLKDVQVNLGRAIEAENCEAEKEALHTEVGLLRKSVTRKELQIKTLERLLTDKTVEVEGKNSKISEQCREIERLKQQLAGLQSMNALLEKHGANEAGAMRAVIAHLKSWLATFQ